MRITLLFCGFMMMTIGLSGCVQDGTREDVAQRLGMSESPYSKIHFTMPEQAVWMGDEGGYHYVRVRSIDSYTGDTDYRIPVESWALGNPFHLTDNASQWRNVQWQDSGLLHNSRFAYVLLNSREKLEGAAANLLQTTQPSTSSTEPTTTAATEPTTTLPAGPTTQPATQQ